MEVVLTLDAAHHLIEVETPPGVTLTIDLVTVNYDVETQVYEGPSHLVAP